MKVSQLLPSVKAHKGIYYNLDERAKNDYKKLYSYLLKHKDKDVYSIAPFLEFNNIPYTYGTYLYKYKRMEIISQNIKH